MIAVLARFPIKAGQDVGRALLGFSAKLIGARVARDVRQEATIRIMELHHAFLALPEVIVLRKTRSIPPSALRIITAQVVQSTQVRAANCMGLRRVKRCANQRALSTRLRSEALAASS